MGGDEALDAFLAARYNALLRRAFLLTGNPDTAADLTHSALLRLVQHWSKLRDRSAAEAYVRRTMVNLLVSDARHRSRAPAPTLLSMPDWTAHSPEDHLVWMSLLLGLPRRQRAALVLRYYEDLSLAATADAMECSVTTVKTHVQRGLEHLRRTLPADLLPQEGGIDE